MKAFKRIITALVLVLVCLPALADDCPVIQTFSAPDVQTGEPVTFTWSYTGGAPQTQTLTGHDFEAPILMGPDTRSYTYTPSKPGMKHAQLAAGSACGTVNASVKYKVKQCNVVAPVMTVDQTSVAPGAAIHASVALNPGHTARWEVINGTASATTGSAITVTAGGAGTVTVNAWVSRGNSCSVLSAATVEVVAACSITEPVVFHPQVATADNWFYLFVENVGPGETFAFAVHGAQIDYEDPQSVSVIAPSQGSFSIDVIVTNGTCTRTFTYPFTVQACLASVTVRPGQAGECGSITAIADFTGTPPFQGNWSDGEYFFTEETSIERPISAGTYSIPWVFDQYCQVPGTGSVTAGSSLPAPSYTIDPIVDGSYWGNDTCPGTVRTARLDGDIPSGATLEWSIPGGSILSGQGTPVVQYAGQEIGPTGLTAIFRDAAGCDSAPYVTPFAQTMGVPQLAVRVEPSTIPAGGTAIVTVEIQNYFTGGFDVSSSLGDTLAWIGNHQYEYRSTNGGGLATITFTASNACATSSTTTTLTIDGGNPLPATARVRAIGTGCTSYSAYAELTGVPPFTGTWSNGETFTTSDSSVALSPATGGTYTLVAFSDVNGPGTVTGSATFDFVPLPQPVVSFSVASTCPNGIVTAMLDTPLPEGGVVTWLLTSPGEILSGEGTATVQIRAADSGAVGVLVSVSAPGACSPYSEHEQIPIQGSVQQPVFSAYPVYVGGSTTFDVTLDPNTETWSFESSFGDMMEVIGNPQPNVYTIRYTSTHGFGESAIRIHGTTHCGLPFETTRAITILAPPPTVTLTSAQGATCGAVLTATFTGAAPFSGTWWDGQTFTTNESSITRFIGRSDYVYLTVTDANGGNAGSEGFFPDLKQPEFVPISGPSQICLGTQQTISAQLPEGWQVTWNTWDTNIRIVSGESSPNVVVEGIQAGPGVLNASYVTPEGCSSFGSWFIQVPAPQGNPVITLPASTIQAGETFEFTVAFDGNYQSLGWESSNGDGVWNVGQDGMTFTLRYQSVNGPGTTTIRAYGTTVCGAEVEATATLVIEP